MTHFLIILVSFFVVAAVSVAWNPSVVELKQTLLGVSWSNSNIEEDTSEECYDYVLRPNKPNFMIPGRSISESKCAEYHWILKQMEKEIRDLENCRNNHRRELTSKERSVITVLQGSPGIFGGRPAAAKEFPHMGALGWYSKDPTKPWIFKCGGTLISENFVLTAGHCTRAPLRSDPDLVDPTPKIVRFGVENIIFISPRITGNPTDVNIKSIVVYPDYAPPKRYYDIALLELEENVNFDLNIIPACLWNNPDRSVGSKVAVTGWGYTEKGQLSDVLQVAYVNILSSEVCDGLLYAKRNRHWQGFADSQICAGNLTGGVDTCQGDSGGPLQIKMDGETEGSIHVVLGVTSFGIKCALRNVPGIYTRVYSFIPWIESVVWGHLLNETNVSNTRNIRI